MCGICSPVIFLALSILVCPAGSAASDGPPTADLCGQLDSSSRLEGLEYHGIRASRVQQRYRYSGGLDALWDGIPGFFSELEQGDPAIRIEAVAQLGLARSWAPPSKSTDELVQRLIDRLRRETQGQVVEEIIRVLGQRVGTPGLAPILVELIQCDRDPGLRSAALDVANSVPDPAMLEPLLEVWRTDAERDDRAAVLRILARLRDRRSLEVAMEGLKEGFVEAPALMRVVGRQQDVAGVIEVYNKYPPPLTMVSGGVLELIGDLGGPDALASPSCATPDRVGLPRYTGPHGDAMVHQRRIPSPESVDRVPGGQRCQREDASAPKGCVGSVPPPDLPLRLGEHRPLVETRAPSRGRRMGNQCTWAGRPARRDRSLARQGVYSEGSMDTLGRPRSSWRAGGSDSPPRSRAWSG